MSDNVFGYSDNFQEIRKIGYRELLNNTTSEPLLTICIPTYKRDDFLEIAVKSVLGQSHKVPFEILICDNDSERMSLPNFLKDESQNIRYIVNNSNLGMTGNWNQLILESKGRNLFILHDDDWLAPNFFDATEQYLGRDEAIIINYQVQDYRQEPIKRLDLKKKLKKIFKLFHPSSRQVNAADIFFSPINPSIYCREKLIELGGYNSKFFPGMDGAIYCKYILTFGGIQLKEFLYNYRVQANESMKSEVFNNFSDIYQKIRLEVSKYSKWLQLIIPHSIEFDKVNMDQNWGDLNRTRERKTINYWLYVFLRLSREVLISIRVL